MACYSLVLTLFPDGAFDDAISKVFSPPGDYHALTRAVQKALYRRWRGFAPPGSSTVVSFPPELAEAQKGKTDCKYIIMCPTMHWPMNISWNLDISYNITWALLAEVDRHNSSVSAAAEAGIGTESSSDSPALTPIRSILMPGLGTGVGEMPFERFVTQFALAVKNFDDAVRNPEKWESLEWEQVASIIDELEGTW